MGKIVKYCGACEESFAQKFGFCPNCGGALKAFEMNPVQDAANVVASNTTETAKVSESPKAVLPEKSDFTAPVMPSTKTLETAPKIQPAVVSAFSSNGNSTNGKMANTAQSRLEKVVTEEPVAKAKEPEVSKPASTPTKVSTTETKPLVAVVTTKANGNGNNRDRQTTNQNFQPTNYGKHNYADDAFRVTVIEEKNVGQRNMLLVGSMFLMLSLVLGGVVYSLFSKDLLIGAIDAGSPLYVTPVEDVPMEVEEEAPKLKIDKKPGGGGGSGREEETPTSKGRLATQMPDPPMIAPSKSIVQLTNPEIKIQATTQGTKQIKQTEEVYGDPNSKYTLSSDGTGSGGGQGSGIGRGQGSGRGNGTGSGIGSGFGGGVGDGNGNGTGSGVSGRTAPPPPPPPAKPEPVGPTTGVVITSKPRAPYTDAARQNQFTGTVTLRVTFLSNGQIGSISPISGQPYGLTEQAISAARGIKFEPAKKNGVPQTVTKQVQYSFTLY